jgi:sortase (surface protein transpeptidase)
MNIFRLAAELFILYILYKFIFDFVIPIYNTTKKVKQQVGEMQEKMQQQMKAQSQQQTTSTPKPKAANEEYIDYEEVK